MPDVISTAPVDVRLWVALDMHKAVDRRCRVAAGWRAAEVAQIETARAAIRRFVDRLGGPEGLAVVTSRTGRV